MPDQPPLLWVYNLVIALLQLAKYQDIVDVHCCKLLEGSYLVLEERKYMTQLVLLQLQNGYLAFSYNCIYVTSTMVLPASASPHVYKRANMCTDPFQ